MANLGWLASKYYGIESYLNSALCIYLRASIPMFSSRLGPDLDGGRISGWPSYSLPRVVSSDLHCPVPAIVLVTRLAQVCVPL